MADYKKHARIIKKGPIATIAFVVLFAAPFLMGSGFAESLKIKGVKGKLLNNIQSRLTELAQTTSLQAESDSDLKKQIEKAMEPYGFFTPNITIARNPLTLIINPGPPLIIEQVTLRVIGEGQHDPKLLQPLLITQGQVFNSKKYEKSKQLLLSTAEQDGYVHASFDKAEILIDSAKNKANITLLLNTGPKYFFGQVRFDPTYISPEVLRRFVPFQYGQPFSAEQVQTFNDHLVSSGYFKTVTVKPETETGASIPINVHLEPASKINYSLGVGYGTDTGIRGRAGMHIVPINRLGHKFNTIALGSLKENALQAQYIIPAKNPLVDQYEITGSASSLNYDSGYSNAFLLSLAKRHNGTNFQRILSINNLYERFHYTYQPRQDKFSFFPKASFTWLNRSDQLFSPSGYHVTLNGLIANKHILSDLSFTQMSLDMKGALMLEKLRTRLYFHSTLGVTQINDINQFPLSLALLLGGSDNLKGYDFNSIGPGKILTYGGVELQKEIKNSWYLTAFFDAGANYRPLARDLKKDLGLGVMWVSPVGPIKVSVAEAIDDSFHFPHKRPKIVISMGPDL